MNTKLLLYSTVHFMIKMLKQGHITKLTNLFEVTR